MKEILTFITALLASLPFNLPLFFYSQSLLIFHFKSDSYMSNALGNKKGLFHPQGTWHKGLFLVAVDRCPTPAFSPASFRDHYSCSDLHDLSQVKGHRYVQPVAREQFFEYMWDDAHNLGLVSSILQTTEPTGLCSFREVYMPKTHSDSTVQDQITDSNKGQGNWSHHLPAVHKRGRPWHSAPGPAWPSGTAVGSGTHMAALGTHVLAAVLMKVPVVASMG